MKNVSHKLSAVFMLALLVSLNGCFVSFDSKEKMEGNGDVVEMSMDQDDFEGLSVNGVFDVLLHPGESHSVTITADENLMEHIKVEVKDDVLHITSEKDFKTKHAIKVDVFAEEINYVRIGGAANCESTGSLESDEIEMKIAGAGNIKLDLDTDELEVSISGAGNLELKGNADESNIGISGAGNLQAYDLKTHKTRLKMSGAGNAEVYADEDLSINLSGIGRVSYKGSPENLEKNVSGLGVVSEG
ncbi:MAG: head GIN domain-containing protein [Bacteroidota bacterium]